MMHFFAAANTENGFYSLFDEIFSPERLRRIYILKGGPGSGKSTMMKTIGAQAEQRGWETEYIDCSSDPDSLDGILIPALQTAVLDGTSPHIQDPVYPGAVERTVNLGAAFDSAGLEKKREQIHTLIGRKKEYYQTAYRLLGAAGTLAKESDHRTQTFFLKEKARAAALRLAQGLRHTYKGAEKHRYLSALSVKGAVTLDTFREKAEKVYAITEKYGLGYAFADVLYDVFSEKGVSMTVCRTPLTAGRIEGIYLDGEDIFFTVCDEKTAESAYKTVNTMRFAHRGLLQTERSSLRFTEKCENMLTDGALAALKEAGLCHAQTEKIYGKYIDFHQINRETEKILAEIFNNNM